MQAQVKSLNKKALLIKEIEKNKLDCINKTKWGFTLDGRGMYSTPQLYMIKRQ